MEMFFQKYQELNVFLLTDTYHTHVHIKFHILNFLPIHSNYMVNIGKRTIQNKNIGIIGHFLKDRDFIGNIGMLEGLR